MSRWKTIEGVTLYFITKTIVGWQNVFTSADRFDIIISSLKYCMQNKGLHLHGYVIMPNHTHDIVSAETPAKLSAILRDLNRYTSQRISEILEKDGDQRILYIFRKAAQAEGRGNHYKVWQEGFHPIAMDSENFFWEKLNYLHENPVRKGLVKQAADWKYSSARNYDVGDHTTIRIEFLQ